MPQGSVVVIGAQAQDDGHPQLRVADHSAEPVEQRTLVLLVQQQEAVLELVDHEQGVS